MDYTTTLSHALNLLARSAKLRFLLGAVTTLGNDLNSHKISNQATGIKLTSLKKLKDTK